MDIDVKWLRVYFLLCVLASLFCALVCFVGFLIKTHKANVVLGYEGWYVSSALWWMAACSPPHLHSSFGTPRSFLLLEIVFCAQLPFYTLILLQSIFNRISEGAFTSSKMH